VQFLVAEARQIVCLLEPTGGPPLSQAKRGGVKITVLVRRKIVVRRGKHYFQCPPARFPPTVPTPVARRRFATHPLPPPIFHRHCRCHFPSPVFPARRRPVRPPLPEPPRCPNPARRRSLPALATPPPVAPLVAHPTPAAACTYKPPPRSRFRPENVVRVPSACSPNKAQKDRPAKARNPSTHSPVVFAGGWRESDTPAWALF